MSELNPDGPRLWVDHLPRLQGAAAVARAAQAAGEEEAAVKYVLGLLGYGPRFLYREAVARTGRAALSFALFHEFLPGFPARLGSSRLRFHYDGVATDLFNDARATPMFSAWSELFEVYGGPDRPVALVFRWPRVKGCRQFCAFHNAPRRDAEYAPGGLKKGDPRLGFRLALPDRDFGVLSVEPLPALLAALGVLSDGGEADPGDDDGGG